MDKHSAEKTTRSRSTELRDGNLREWLFDILTCDQFDRVADLPYRSRLRLKRWYQNESDRLAPVMSRVAGMLHPTPSVDELLDLAASDTVDLQGVGNWLRDHREELSPQLLVELVSAAMGHGIAQFMRDRAGKRQGGNREKKAEALRLWNDDYKDKPQMSKANAARRIAAAVGLAESTVRRYLQGK